MCPLTLDLVTVDLLGSAIMKISQFIMNFELWYKSFMNCDISVNVEPSNTVVNVHPSNSFVVKENSVSVEFVQLFVNGMGRVTFHQSRRILGFGIQWFDAQ